MQSRKIIKLPAGGELELDFEDKFLEAVRLHVNKGADEEVTDDDIRLMIFNCFSGAINEVTIPDESN
jgi:hypothetical protein